MTSLPAAGTVAAAGLAAVGAWTWTQWPTTGFLRGTVAAGPHGRELALTFDDGPHDRYTPEVLERLAKADVRATFFLIGEHARNLPSLVREMAAAGHLIGNHTVTHPNLAFCSGRRIREELRGSSAILEDLIGAPVRFFRPPYGGRRPTVMRAAAELGMQTVLWNAMGFDWRKGRTAKQIMKAVERSIRANRAADRGTTILLHDGAPAREAGAHRGATVVATGSLLERGAAAGYRFVTVEDWWGAAAAGGAGGAASFYNGD
jgi:peptidoglycan-N-acetylglucosamine deacetylase